MTVFGYLEFCAEIRGYAGSQRLKKVEETIEKCFLAEVKYQTINTLSKGYKQRVCFAQSLDKLEEGLARIVRYTERHYG